MSRRLSTQDCPQVHKRDLSRNPTACGPCGQPAPLITNTVAPLRHGVLSAAILRRGVCGRVCQNWKSANAIRYRLKQASLHYRLPAICFACAIQSSESLRRRVSRSAVSSGGLASSTDCFDNRRCEKGERKQAPEPRICPPMVNSIARQCVDQSLTSDYKS
jgi:hypothetical protein